MSDVVAAATLILVPGLALGAAIYAGPEIGIVTRAAMSIGLGYGLVALVAFLLATLSQLRTPTLVASLAVVTAAATAAAVRRRAPSGLRVGLRRDLRDERWALALGFAVIVAVAAVRWGHSPLVNLTETAPWRYWADALEIADGHRLPHATLQWGQEIVPTVSKVLLNSFGAASILLLGDEALSGMRALLWIVALGQALALWAVGREFGLGWTGILLPLLLIANTTVLNDETTLDLFRFTAEGFGRVVAFSALAIGVRAVREGAARDVAVAAALFAVGALTHLVPVVVTMALLACYVIVFGVRERRLAPAAGALATMGTAACLFAGAGWFVAGGDLGFEGAASSNRYADFGAFDPTRYFATGDGTPANDAGGLYDSPGWLMSDLVTGATGLAPSGTLVTVVTAGMTAVAAVSLVWLPGPLRAIGASAWGLGVLLLVATLAFSSFYETHVPARFGPRRLFDYSSLPLVLGGLAVLEAVVVSLPARAWSAFITLAVVAAAAALLLPASRPPARLAALGRASLPALEWIKANVPCDARLLSSRRTAGSFQALTGRASVDEGMAPYLRPRLLAQATTMLRAIGRFFEKPTASGSDLLSRYGVDYVVVVRARTLGSEGDYVARVDGRGLRQQQYLARVFTSPAVDIYRARVQPATSALPRASDFPGYVCPGRR
jgi:hypothetical protein